MADCRTGGCAPSARFLHGPIGKFAVSSKLCHSNDDCKNYSGDTPDADKTPFDACCSSAMAGPYKFCAPSAATTIAQIVELSCN